MTQLAKNVSAETLAMIACYLASAGIRAAGEQMQGDKAADKISELYIGILERLIKAP